MLSHRVVDHDLALTYLDVFSIQEGMKLLSAMRKQFVGKFSRIQVQYLLPVLQFLFPTLFGCVFLPRYCGKV